MKPAEQDNNKPIRPVTMNEREMISIRSLIMYVANQKSCPISSILRDVHVHFKTAHPDDLREVGHEPLVKFLVDSYCTATVH